MPHALTPPVRRCRPFGRIVCLAVLSAVVLLAGCQRDDYRRRADREVQSLIESGSTDPRWPLDDYHVYPDRRSRFYDPYSPDCPPMPVDDPVSNQLMQFVDGKRGYKHWGKCGQTGESRLEGLSAIGRRRHAGPRPDGGDANGLAPLADISDGSGGPLSFGVGCDI